jgi:hypothetical protein
VLILHEKRLTGSANGELGGPLPSLPTDTNLPMGYHHGERPNWNIPFRKLARDVGLSPDLKAGYVDAATMLDPILAARAKGRWDPLNEHSGIELSAPVLRTCWLS